MPKYQSKRDQLYVASLYHDIWRLNIYMVWCEDRKRIQDFIQVNHEGNRDAIEFPRGEAAMYLIKSRGYDVPVICLPFKWVASPEQVSALAHEVLHASITLHRLRDISLPSSKDPYDNDEEGLCYLTEWIMLNALEFLVNQEDHKFKFADEIIKK